MSLTPEAKQALDRLVAPEPPSEDDYRQAFNLVRAIISEPPDWTGYPRGSVRILGMKVGGITPIVLK